MQQAPLHERIELHDPKLGVVRAVRRLECGVYLIDSESLPPDERHMRLEDPGNAYLVQVNRFVVNNVGKNWRIELADVLCLYAHGSYTPNSNWTVKSPSNPQVHKTPIEIIIRRILEEGLSVDIVIACNPKGADLHFTDIIYSHGNPKLEGMPMAGLGKEMEPPHHLFGNLRLSEKFSDTLPQRFHTQRIYRDPFAGIEINFQ